MVPMLAWRVAPSERTRWAMVVLMMAGTAPQITVQRR